jgi:hypothetical protein
MLSVQLEGVLASFWYAYRYDVKKELSDAIASDV